MGQGDGQEVAWLDLIVEGVRAIHERMLEIGGGAPGEHTASLYAACARPFQSAFGEDIYNDPYERAAALLHAVVCDHVFVDGNKRAGTVAAIEFLRAENVFTRDAGQADIQLALLGEVTLSTASGQLTVEQVTFWIRRIFELPGT